MGSCVAGPGRLRQSRWHSAPGAFTLVGRRCHGQEATEGRVTRLAHGPVGAPATPAPDGTGHPALRGLPAIWLRANCPCAACRDPGSGQRLAAITDLPADVTVAGVLAS